MRKKKTLLLMVVIVALLLAACGSNSNKGNANQTGVPAANTSNSSNDNENQVPAQPVELSMHFHDMDIHVYKEDWPVWQKIQEMTNTKIKGVAPPSATNSKEVFNLMIASSKLPDIIHGLKPDMNKVALQGALEPLDDLIAQYAPNIQNFLDENPWVRAGSVASDGKLYYIPYVMEGKHSMGWFIRQDWLTKLNLDVPKNVDEFYQVLKAFREQDPNENGVKDEVPYFNRAKDGIDFLIPLFSVRPKWQAVDGKVQFGKYTAEYEHAIATISQWYSEGLVDKEIYTRGSNARDVLFEENVGGLTQDWFPSTASYNDRMKDKIPNFSFPPFAPPADINGKVWHEWSRNLLAEKGWGIASTSQNKEEVMKFLDFFHTEEGRRLMNFGLEGVHYDMIDGKPIFKESVLNGSDPVNQQLWNVGAQLEIGYQMDLNYEQQWTNPIAAAGVQDYVSNDYFAEQFPPLSFTPDEDKIISQKWPAIETYINEMQQRWVMGAESVQSSYQKYLAQLQSMGIDEVIAIYQAAYDRYQASL